MHVTCLERAARLGARVTPTTIQVGAPSTDGGTSIFDNASGAGGATVNVTCPAGYPPIRAQLPGRPAASPVVRESYAQSSPGSGCSSSTTTKAPRPPSMSTASPRRPPWTTGTARRCPSPTRSPTPSRWGRRAANEGIQQCPGRTRTGSSAATAGTTPASSPSARSRAGRATCSASSTTTGTRAFNADDPCSPASTSGRQTSRTYYQDQPTRPPCRRPRSSHEHR